VSRAPNESGEQEMSLLVRFFCWIPRPLFFAIYRFIFAVSNALIEASIKQEGEQTVRDRLSKKHLLALYEVFYNTK